MLENKWGVVVGGLALVADGGQWMLTPLKEMNRALKLSVDYSCVSQVCVHEASGSAAFANGETLVNKMDTLSFFQELTVLFGRERDTKPVIATMSRDMQGRFSVSWGKPFRGCESSVIETRFYRRVTTLASSWAPEQRFLVEMLRFRTSLLLINWMCF